jgi:hypothetical protein
MLIYEERSVRIQYEEVGSGLPRLRIPRAPWRRATCAIGSGRIDSCRVIRLSDAV